MSLHKGVFAKFKLVDEEELHRMVEKEIRNHNPELNAMADRKMEMANILQNTEGTQDKLALLKANQQQYAQHKLNLGKPTIPRPLDSNMSEGVTTATTAAIPLQHDPYIQSIDVPSATIQHPALDHSILTSSSLPLVQPIHKQRLNYLSALIQGSGGLISRNPVTDELVLDGTVIPNSSFHDLIREFYIRSGRANLNGQDKLLDAIARMLSQGGKWERIGIKSIIPRSNYIAQIKTRLIREQKGKGIRKSLVHHFIPPPGRKVKYLRLY